MLHFAQYDKVKSVVVKAEILHFVQNDRKNAIVVNTEMLGSA